MKRLLWVLIFAALPVSGAWAQTTSAVVVSSCGTPPTTYTAGQPSPVTQDTTGKLCDTGGGGGGGGNVTIVAPLGSLAPADGVATTLDTTDAANLAAIAAAQGGPSSSASIGIVPAIAGSASSGVVLKNAPGNFYSAYAMSTAKAWIMVFNATAVPSNGSTTAGTASGNLEDCVELQAGPTGYGVSINYTTPEPYSTGISLALSSTACATLTLATTGYLHGSAK
jgi:hypothetical protein